MAMDQINAHVELLPPPSPAFLFLHGGVNVDLVKKLLAISYPVAGLIISPETPGLYLDFDLRGHLIDSDEARSQLIMERIQDVIVLDISHSDGPAQLAAYQAANRWAPPPTRLLHAAATIPYFRPQYIGRSACFGFPGSGNHVTQNILALLLESAQHQENTGYEFFCQRLAENASHLMMAVLEYALRPLGSSRLNIGIGRTEHATVRAVFEDGGMIAIEDMPYCGWIGRHFGGHSVITERMIKIIKNYGYATFILTRNPTDIILSNATKTTRPPELAMRNQAWRRDIANYLYLFYSAAESHRGQFTELRYGDLMKNPEREIIRWAESLDLAIDRTRAREIWQKVGNRPLTEAGREHFRPWPTPLKLNGELWNEMDGLGIGSLYEAFWYDLPRDEELEDIEMNSLEDMIHASPLFGYWCPEHKKELRSGIVVGANNSSLLESALLCLNRSDLQRYFGMLGNFWKPD